MALDKLDVCVITALALALVYFFGKDYIFPSSSENSAGFVAVGQDDGERDLAKVIKRNDKNAVVFFASQTGTAEDFAHKFSKELHSKFGLNVLIADLADYDFDNLQDLDPQCLFFFFVATYGEGEPTDNSVEFFNWLENDADQLATFQYTVFGLGNSTYEFFNAMGVKLNDKLESLGADRIAPYGHGDDGVGTMDEDYLAWKDECFDALKNNLNLEEHELKFEPSFELIEEPSLSASDASVSEGEPNSAYLKKTRDLSKGPFDHTHPYLAPIKESRELFNSSKRSCVHAEFDLADSNLRYSTGDHLAIWPSNANEHIEKFIECFGLELKRTQVFSLKKLDSTAHIPFPTPATFEAVIRHYLEITGPISRQDLLSIAPFAPSENAKKTCLSLGGDKALFAKEIHDEYLNLADALLQISEGSIWDDVPFVFLIELIGSMQPRYYSISSSSLSEKTRIHVTAVVEAEVKSGRVVSGVATNLLKNIEAKQNSSDAKLLVTYDLNGPKNLFESYKLPVHVRRSTFKLPSNPSVPIILVGPGTGVAPMRAFVREKIAHLRASENTKAGQVTLFYGCRSPDEDFLYKDEWPEYAKKLGPDFTMEVAFSRTQGKKVYVQDKIMEKAAAINEQLEKGAFIYVCGDASKMARDVQATFVKIISEHRNVTPEKAAELVRSLKTLSRYQEDVW